MADSQRPSEPVSYVHRDEIWKAHVKGQMDSAKVWSSKWGFLVDVYEEYEVESKKLKEATKMKHHHHHQPEQCQTPAGKDRQAGSSPPVPQTSQALIGWNSGHSRLQLEGNGPVHHGRCSFLKALDWPLGSCS